MGLTTRIRLKLIAAPEGGWTVTCPLLPELVTEGDTVEDALSNVPDALAAVIELYEDLERPLPSNLSPGPLASDDEAMTVETIVAMP